MAIILENFELDEDAKRAGQIGRMVDKFQQKQNELESTYFSYVYSLLYSVFDSHFTVWIGFGTRIDT